MTIPSDSLQTLKTFELIFKFLHWHSSDSLAFEGFLLLYFVFQNWFSEFLEGFNCF